MSTFFAKFSPPPPYCKKFMEKEFGNSPKWRTPLKWTTLNRKLKVSQFYHKAKLAVIPNFIRKLADICCYE